MEPNISYELSKCRLFINFIIMIKKYRNNQPTTAIYHP